MTAKTLIDKTLKHLAMSHQIPVEYLIKQFAKFGITKSENDVVNQKERELMSTYFIKQNVNNRKLVLQRRTCSILNIPMSNGKSRSIQVEVRKKYTYTRYSNDQQAKSEHIQQKRNILEVNNEIYANSLHISSLKNNLDNKLQSSDCKYTKDKTIIHTKKKKLRTAGEFSDLNAQNNTVSKISELDNYHNSQVINSNLKSFNFKKKASNNCTKSTFFYESTKDNNFYNRSFTKQNFIKPMQITNRNVVIGETITILELADKMAIKSSRLVKTMTEMGIPHSEFIDQKTAQLIAEKMGHKVILYREDDLEKSIINNCGNKIDIYRPRAPVVTIMGHVDHGKTSLLDCICSTNIACNEVGNITQRMSTHCIRNGNDIITFIDTPGHTAFSAMRARSAKITDIIVLVVAADDGVMPQTIESIEYAKYYKIPVIVAINKIDKVDTNLDRIKDDLTRYNIISEEWGGENIFVNISAKMNIGIDKLLQAILLQAEILELTAIHDGIASCVVIESFLDKNRGPVAMLLVRNGTLRKGDTLLCGLEYGRVRAMRDTFGNKIIQAGPSIPVEILGMSGILTAGDEATVVKNEKKAREVALYRQIKFRDSKLAYQKQNKIKNSFTDYKKDVTSILKIILKTDIQGSSEAILNALKDISNSEVELEIISSGVGNITETDAMLATTSNAVIVGFNVRTDVPANNIIRNENLKLYQHSIIYELIDNIKLLISNLSKLKQEQVVIGTAEIRSIFKSSKYNLVVGCIVIKGIVRRYSNIRILRKDIVIYEGVLESLRRFKDDISEVRANTECGIGIKNCNNIHIGDIIESFQ